jgi:hypothetical protein
VFGDLGAHDDLCDLMTDRIAVADAVLHDGLAAPAARRRPVLNEPVGISDHLTRLTRAPGLTALTALGTLLGPRLAESGESRDGASEPLHELRPA